MQRGGWINDFLFQYQRKFHGDVDMSAAIALFLVPSRRFELSTVPMSTMVKEDNEYFIGNV